MIEKCVIEFNGEGNDSVLRPGEDGRDGFFGGNHNKGLLVLDRRAASRWLKMRERSELLQLHL